MDFFFTNSLLHGRDAKWTQSDYPAESGPFKVVPSEVRGQVFRTRTSPDAIDLISQLLQYEPEGRIRPLEVRSIWSERRLVDCKLQKCESIGARTRLYYKKAGGSYMGAYQAPLFPSPYFLNTSSISLSAIYSSAISYFFW